VAQGVGPEFKPQYHKKKVVVLSHLWQYNILNQLFTNLTQPDFNIIAYYDWEGTVPEIMNCVGLGNL
jgi:hypothetical protein